MAWLSTAIKLLIKYGPSAMQAAMEIYRLIEAIKNEGHTTTAELRKASLDYELAALSTKPRFQRSAAGIMFIRNAARVEYANAMQTRC